MNCDTLVVGVDFSEASLRAAHWSVHHFAPDAEVVLVHVADATESVQAENRLEQLGRTLASPRVRTVVRTGRATDALAAAAREFAADILVVGEHGERGGFRDALGSTAERMLRTCTVPTLLARGQSDHPPRRILVCVEDGNLTGFVLAWGAAIARRFDAHVILLHVITPQVPGRVRLVSGSDASHALEEKMLASAEDWLVKCAERAGFDPERIERLVVEGDARGKVLDAAERTQADLIVMGSRGSGTAGQILLGSTARAILRRAGCPVLVVTEHATA